MQLRDNLTAMMSISDIRAFLSDLPDDTEIHQSTFDNPEFVIIVSSAGQAQRIVAKTTRMFFFTIHLKVAS